MLNTYSRWVPHQPWNDGDAAPADDGNIPIASANEIHLCLGQQFVDAAPIEADDDLVADDDRRGAAALVSANQLLQRRCVLRDVAFDEVDALLRKILFRAMARASAIGGEDFNRVFGHFRYPPCCSLSG
jgi:hypothetical protein